MKCRLSSSTPARLRWADLIRTVVYQTLPYVGIACLWVGAWSKSLESKVRRELEPHESSEIYPTPPPAMTSRFHAAEPVAGVDQD